VGHPATVGGVTSLAEALKYGPDATLLIVACDDLGSSYAANVGVYESLRSGMATTGGLMVPCPWAREAASRYRGEDVGVHLTLNAEYDLYRWGPITHAPSLLDGDGGFPRTLDDLWDHADLDEVRKECRAQIERAIYWGFDVSHLSSHLGALEFRPEFFDIALELAIDFELPLRLSSASAERSVGFPFRRLAAEESVCSPDHLVRPGTRGARSALDRLLSELRPGVTEVVLRPAIDNGELRALAPDWASRVDDHDVVNSGHSLRALADRAGVTLIGYRQLRDLQRITAAGQPPPGPEPGPGPDISPS
jgi:chitin disaccharide deacetylase